MQQKVSIYPYLYICDQQHTRCILVCSGSRGMKGLRFCKGAFNKLFVGDSRHQCNIRYMLNLSYACHRNVLGRVGPALSNAGEPGICV